MDIPTVVAHLVEANYGILDLIVQLGQFRGSQDAREELVSGIQTRMRNYDNSLEALEFEINDVTDAAAQRQYLVSLDRLKENLKLSRSKFRAAQFQARENDRMSLRQQREALFGDAESRSKDTDKFHNMSNDDRVLEASHDITASIRRMHHMAQTEALKSSINVEELDASTKQLKQLESKYTAFDVMLSGSQRLIRHLEQADRWDRIYMQAALAFLGGVVLWILWHRILWRLLRIFVLPIVKLVLWPVLKLVGRTHAQSQESPPVAAPGYTPHSDL